MSKRKKQRKILKRDLIDEVDRYLGWVFIMLIGILPLLVRCKLLEFTAPRIVSALLNTGIQADIFSYYKWVFMIYLALIALIMLLLKMFVFSYELRQSYINIPLLLLVIFIILSFLTAEYKSIAMVGLYEQFDGSITYLCYFALLIVAANTVFKDWFERYTTYALGMVTILNMVIILFDFFGHNLFKYSAIKSLVFPPNLQGTVAGTFNSSLSNPDYVSGLAAALFAFFLILTLLKTRLKQRVLYGVCVAASFILMLASLASSGFVSLLIISPLIFAVAYLSQNRKQTCITAGAILALCLVIFIMMNTYNHNVSIQSIGFIKSSSGTVNEGPQPQISESEDFKLPAPGSSAGTGRVYIWNETLKLIKNKPIFGYGQDTLSYYFPQNDINMIANQKNYNTLIAKSHNMYIGLAYGSGIPALLAMLVLFVMHFYHTGRRLLKVERNEAIIFPAALFIFFCVFIVQWLFNDSVIGSSVIFWTLLGVGVSSNIDYEALSLKR